MSGKTLIVAAVLVGFAAPAFAATATYFVSQDTRTHKCYVVKKVGKHGMQIGTASYTSKAAAAAALKAAPECQTKLH